MLPNLFQMINIKMRNDNSMDYTKLSIKHFIGDLPKIINENFEKIKIFIDTIYDSVTGTIKSTNADFTGKVKCNSVITNNITVNDEKGNQVTIAELVKRIEELEKLAGIDNTVSSYSLKSKKRASK